MFIGKTQRVAYKEVYQTSKKWSDETVDVEASKLFNKPKIILRYNQKM